MRIRGVRIGQKSGRVLEVLIGKKKIMKWWKIKLDLYYIISFSLKRFKN